MVLSSVDVGKKIIIQDIDGRKGIRSKLYSMCLIPGQSLRFCVETAQTQPWLL